jgi:hypothetical protein
VPCFRESHKSSSARVPKHASTGRDSSASDLCQACGKPHKLEECLHVRHEVRRDPQGLSSDGEEDESFNEVRLLPKASITHSYEIWCLETTDYVIIGMHEFENERFYWWWSVILSRKPRTEIFEPYNMQLERYKFNMQLSCCSSNMKVRRTWQF